MDTNTDTEPAQLVVIRAVTPTLPVVSAVPQVLEFLGDGFAEGLQLRVRFPGGPPDGIVVTTPVVEVVSDTIFRIRAVLSTPITVDLRVENPDGTVSPYFRLTIASPAVQLPVLTAVVPGVVIVGPTPIALQFLGENLDAVVRLVVATPDLPEVIVPRTMLDVLGNRIVLVAPILRAGTYRIAAETAAGLRSNFVTLVARVDAPLAPIIDGLEPDIFVAAPGIQFLRIRGSNFIDGASVILNTPAGSITLTAPAIRVSPTSVDLFLTLASPGSFSVQIVNPDLQSSNVIPFNVRVGGGSEPDLTLQVTPAALTIAAGDLATIDLGALSVNGLAGAVEFSVMAPANLLLTTSFNPVTATLVANGGVTTALTIATNAQSPIGTFTIQVAARVGAVIRTTPLTITLVSGGGGQPNIVLQASPVNLTVTQGQTTSVNLNVQSVNGFTGTLSFQAPNLPGNLAALASFSPNTATIAANGPVNTTLTIPTNTFTPTGTFNISLEVRSGPIIRVVVVSLTVLPVAGSPDISIEVTPVTQTIVRGQTAAFNVTVRSLNGLTGDVAFSTRNLPANLRLTATWSPSGATLFANGSATSTLTIASSLVGPPARVTIDLQAQIGAIIRTTPVTLIIN